MSDLVQKYGGFGLGVAIVGWLMHKGVMTQYPHDMNDEKVFAAHLALAAAIFFYIWDRMM